MRGRVDHHTIITPFTPSSASEWILEVLEARGERESVLRDPCRRRASVHVAVRLLDLVEEHHGEGPPPDRLRELPAVVVPHVARRRADYGVVPIENSTEGAVSHTLDLFVDSPLRICAQILLRIENNLLAAIPRESITTLYSHPQVFGQCKNWILRHLPNADLVEVSSTTKAAHLAREKGPEGAAALGGKLAAELAGLEVL